MDESPKNQSLSPDSFETGRPRSKSSKKTRRVSQRRELAVVTLGMVASITGLGGFLTANPPSWATAPETAPSEITTPVEPSRGGESAQQRETNEIPAPTSVETVPVQKQPPQVPAMEAPPVYSAPSSAPAAKSRGS